MTYKLSWTQNGEAREQVGTRPQLATLAAYLFDTFRITSEMRRI